MRGAGEALDQNVGFYIAGVNEAGNKADGAILSAFNDSSASRGK